ncbi:hypothetical protein B0T25DRAFT_632693 [Lasiosphaeria hispida]|uniref:Uncharacterized protein n=1 Tax=Lasiosphaeria hispida TaxID=260671 RepID=A0AAJ0MC49_9PEZI|nr:hypothetical protein B0T25DRAFT_632693 [Lasiosphaeria hispida]
MDHNAALVLPNAAMGLNFFDFPAEVRLMIYCLLLITDKPIQPPTHLGDGRPPRRYPIGLSCKLYIAMLLANKRLSGEVAHFVYRNNTFQVSLKYQRQWLTNIGYHNAKAVEHLILACDGRERKGLESLLQMQRTIIKRAPSLREITYRLLWHDAMSLRGIEYLLNTAVTPTWKRMKSLEQITVEKTGTYIADDAEKRMYKSLCNKARVPVRASQQRHLNPGAPSRIYLVAQPEHPRKTKPKKQLDYAKIKRTLWFLKRSHHN